MIKTITLKYDDKDYKKLSLMKEDLLSLGIIEATSWEKFVMAMAKELLNE